MKKIFTLALIVSLNSTAHSQFSFGMHPGTSDKNDNRNAFAVSVQYDVYTRGQSENIQIRQH
jgi:hypothetical protein